MELLKCLFVPQDFCTFLCPGCSSSGGSFSSRLPPEKPSLTIFNKALFPLFLYQHPLVPFLAFISICNWAVDYSLCWDLSPPLKYELWEAFLLPAVSTPFSKGLHRTDVQCFIMKCWWKAFSVPGTTGLGAVLIARDQKSEIEAANGIQRFLPCMRPDSSSVIPGPLLLNLDATSGKLRPLR